MKKNAAMVLGLMLTVTLTACGGGAASQGGNESASNPPKAETKSEVKTIKIGHGASESYHMHRAWLNFKETLESAGNFAVEIYPSSQFGNDAEMIENVQTGDLTMATPPSSFLTDQAPEMALIELPYVFPSRDAAVDTLKGEWGQKQLAELNDDGLYGLGYLENGLRHLTNSKLPVRKPEDLSGLKLRTMQVPAHVYLWNDLGASAEGAPFAELYNNLSTGRFDGQENPIAHIYAQRFYEVQSYLTLTGHVYTGYVPVMNMDFWSGLSGEEQQQVQEAFNQAFEYQLQLIAEEESKQLEEIAGHAQFKTEIIELTDAEKQAFIEAAQPTLDHYREELGAEAFDAFKQAIETAGK
ncbi:DctP family TRAP transporter solute-binding subunit [Paenibacillus sp.]|uniref:DctP family TRAP transporter solute-binding subunit n=1 Tax=Paenibacillus sp. TaxID=58172 RepID=UPI002D54C429|nr:DctP family TRAP transporter solute-binding subunit [Paenibacillus sp.]HZG85932.1 DctP family TRAP transporter solute-binding subunit [Paenibacillus sp.]